MTVNDSSWFMYRSYIISIVGVDESSSNQDDSSQADSKFESGT